MTKFKNNIESWGNIKLELGNHLMVHAILNEKLNKQFPHLKNIYHYTTLNGFISIIENQCLY